MESPFWEMSKAEFFSHVGTVRGKRALFHGMVIVTQQGGKRGGRETKIDRESAFSFYIAWIRSGRGDELPRLPSERSLPDFGRGDVR